MIPTSLFAFKIISFFNMISKVQFFINVYASMFLARTTDNW